jgi:hypothetical protein
MTRYLEYCPPHSCRSRSALICCLAGIVLAGCTSPAVIESHAEWLHETIRTYPGETSARVIAAAERVLKASDPHDVKFDYGTGGFRVTRPFLIYAVVASEEGQDSWSFRASENEVEATASVSFRQAVTDKFIVPIASPSSSHLRFGVVTASSSGQKHVIGSYRLFFARMDYLLGKRKDWVLCADAPALLKLDPEAPGTDGLCGITFQGDETRPPPLIAPSKAGLKKPNPVRETLLNPSQISE